MIRHNNDTYQYILNLVDEKNKNDFIKNSKKELISKVISLCERKINFYLKDEEDDPNYNQNLFYSWTLYLNCDNSNNVFIHDIILPIHSFFIPNVQLSSRSNSSCNDVSAVKGES